MKSIFALAFWLAFISMSAWAYQTGTVLSEDEPIVREPRESAAIIVAVKKGQELHMSSKTRDGYFKVLVPGTKNEYGWINAQGVRPLELADELRQASVQVGDTHADDLYESFNNPPHWSLTINGYFTSYTPSEVQSVAGQREQTFSSKDFEFEAGLKPRGPMSAVLTYTHLGGEGRDYSLSAYLFNLWVEYIPFKWEYQRLALGAGAGPALMHISAIERDSAGVISATGDQKFTTGTASTRVTFKQYIGRHFNIGGGLGYRLLLQPNMALASRKITLSMSGIFFELGVGAEF